ncbi:MAG: alpha/beta fold hydrolase [Verrucomicrobiae bacterium]|nr:alpha/beta fold hydrolase [Verrucomicrobiae bacterium]
MRILAALLLLTSSVAGITLAAEEEKPEDGLSGLWTGVLSVGAQELPVEFQFTALPGGQFAGNLKSPTQSPQPIPLTLVTFRNRELSASAGMIGGQFKGKVASSGRTIRGDWTQGGVTLPLELSYNPAGFQPKRPQEPRPPFSYDSEEVTFENELGGNRLAGTLTLPKDRRGALPAVVLISGSGPQDRDETILGHKPFAVIADFLTRNGIAVLRYDDRGTGASTGNFSYATTLDFATDAAAAVTFLKNRPEVDPTKIGLIGHSEGGLVAPIVAVKRPGDVAFLVLLAAPGLRGDEILMTQSRALLSAAGMKPDLVDLMSRLNRSIYDALVLPDPNPETVRKLAAEFETEVKKLSPEDAKALGEIGTVIEDQMKSLQSPWFAQFLTLDPAEFLKKTTIPVLALNGERDLQVLADPNLAAISAHLTEAGNTHFETKKLPELNHLFQRAATGLPGEYWRIETTIEPSVLKSILEWIQRTTSSKR